MPYADPEAQRRFRRELGQRRREAGQCHTCAAKAVPGMSRCQACRDRLGRNG